jgi:quercetin dioxygenase-like cupin family protein
MHFIQVDPSQKSKATVHPRRIYNPVQKAYVTFIETAADTGGKRTTVEVELAPGGGAGLHFHKTYIKRFAVLEGELQVQTGKTVHALKAGKSVAAEPNVNHRFFSTSQSVCKFRVTLEPASRGFEESLQIGYGLSRDGQCNAKGMPKNPLALAWLFSISEINLPGWRSVFEFILHAQAKKALKMGIDMELREKYVRF